MDYIVDGLQLLTDFQLMDFQLMDYIVDGLQLLIDFQLMDFKLMDFLLIDLTEWIHSSPLFHRPWPWRIGSLGPISLATLMKSSGVA